MTFEQAVREQMKWARVRVELRRIGLHTSADPAGLALRVAAREATKAVKAPAGRVMQ